MKITMNMIGEMRMNMVCDSFLMPQCEEYYSFDANWDEWERLMREMSEEDEDYE